MAAIDPAHQQALAALEAVRAELQAMADETRCEMAALRARLDRVEQRRRPAPDGARLLSAIAIRFGGAVFSAADLARARDPELRRVLDGASRRAIGQWLRQLHRTPRGRYVLCRIGRDARGALWALTVSDT